MATNLSLDPKLLERTLRVSGEKTKKAAVTKTASPNSSANWSGTFLMSTRRIGHDGECPGRPDAPHVLPTLSNVVPEGVG